MLVEYLSFAVDLIVHIAIIAVMIGVAVSFIAFWCCIAFWIWDKITKEIKDEF